MNTIFLSLILAGWGPNGCGPVGPADSVPGYEWVSTGAKAWACYYQKKQIGHWNATTEVWRDFDGKAFGPEKDAPWKIVEAAPTPKEVPNFGILTDGLTHPKEPKYWCSKFGRYLTRSEAYACLLQPAEGPGVPDDTGKMWIVVIGDPSETKPVAKDLAESHKLAPWRDRVILREYPRDHWHVARYGYVTTGKPTVCCVASSADSADMKKRGVSNVLCRPHDGLYHGADDLAMFLAFADAELARRKEPNYVPEKDPDPRKLPIPKPGPGPDPQPFPWAILALLAGVGILVFARSKMRVA